MIPMLQSAPKHIADENFSSLEIILNITGRLEQHYYDDGVEGLFRATLKDGMLEITTQDIPAEKFRIYAGCELTQIFVNAEAKAFRREDAYYLV